MAFINDLFLLSGEDPFDDESVMSELRLILEDLFRQMPAPVFDYISNPPGGWPSRYRTALHYRGCDYLDNVPPFHTPNLDRNEFLRRIRSLIDSESGLFLASDDRHFSELLSGQGFQHFVFDDVMRGRPGVGIHHQRYWQKVGLEHPDKRRLLGLQVMRDCFHLSKADLYIGSNSNLMMFAKLLNPSLEVINVHCQ